MITRDCFFGLCAHRWFHVILTVPPAPCRYPNVLSSVEPLEHKDLHVSTQSTSETSRTRAVWTHQFSGVGRPLFPTWTHIWRRWDYANTGLLRPWICPDKKILAFLPLPWGQHWRHSLAETWAPRVKQQSSIHTVFLGNFFTLPEKRATEGIRPLQTVCCKIQNCAKKQERCMMYLLSHVEQPSKPDLSSFSPRYNVEEEDAAASQCCWIQLSKKGKALRKKGCVCQTRTC